MSSKKSFLPMTRDEMRARGWRHYDVLLVTGDAYVDHPAFGAAVIGRTLEAAGLRVCIVAQPPWTGPEAFAALGRPKLFVGVTAGAMDSMVANYTAGKKKRRDDAFSPGGRAGLRPNYATIVYTNIVRSLFPGTPVVIGGIEASLRRFAHYDYWKDHVRRSILLDSKADLLVAGMGEAAVLAIAERLRVDGDLHGIPGTVENLALDAAPADAVLLPSYEEVGESKRTFLEAAIQMEKAVCARGRAIAQRHGDRLVVEWPAPAPSSETLDAVYALPYERRAHPSYQAPIPALEPVQFSVVSHRGCFGGCSFCALSLHQGRQIVSRSAESVLSEIEALTHHSDFRGTITDVGGPTVNMYGMKGRDAAQCERCRRVSCLHPDVCSNLDASHAAQLELLQRASAIPGVKHLFLASGIRHDLLVERGDEQKAGKARRASGNEADDRKAFLQFLAMRATGGHLSAAPEHVADGVLRRMRKPAFRLYRQFAEQFKALSAQAGKQQYVMPYFIASFPGSGDKDMDAVTAYLREEGLRLQQVQDFMPGPMTLAAAMYYSELDAETFEPIYVAKTPLERRRQHSALLYHEHEESSERTETRPERRPAAFHKGDQARPKPNASAPRPASAKKWAKAKPKPNASAKRLAAAKKWEKPKPKPNASFKKWENPRPRPDASAQRPASPKKWEKPNQSASAARPAPPRPGAAPLRPASPPRKWEKPNQSASTARPAPPRPGASPPRPASPPKKWENPRPRPDASAQRPATPRKWEKPKQSASAKRPAPPRPGASPLRPASPPRKWENPRPRPDASAPRPAPPKKWEKPNPNASVARPVSPRPDASPKKWENPRPRPDASAPRPVPPRKWEKPNQSASTARPVSPRPDASPKKWEKPRPRPDASAPRSVPPKKWEKPNQSASTARPAPPRPGASPKKWEKPKPRPNTSAPYRKPHKKA